MRRVCSIAAQLGCTCLSLYWGVLAAEDPDFSPTSLRWDAVSCWEQVKLLGPSAELFILPSGFRSRYLEYQTSLVLQLGGRVCQQNRLSIN